MGWRALSAVGLLVVGVGAVVIALFGPALARSDSTQYVTAQATTTNVLNQAVANGNIAASATYGLSFGAKPRVIDSASSSSGGGSGTWLVNEVHATVGQKVKAGDLLAVADAGTADTSLAVAQANLATAQARYDTDSGGPSTSDQQSAQLSVDQAQQQLDNAKKSRDDTISQNAIKLTQAQDAVDQAQTQLSDDRSAGAPDTVIKADKTNLKQARDSLSLQRIQLDASNRQADEQVTSAELALESAQNNYNSNTAPATAAVIASDHAAVLQAQQQVDDAQSQVDGATLRAPIDGTITAVTVVAGADAPSGDAIQLIGTQMQVSAGFAESDLPNLAMGQKASVTVTATGDALSGTVSSINPVAASSGASSVVSYTVTVDLGIVPAKVMPGMSAQVAVTIAEADNVVAIPSIALAGTSGNYTVRVMDSAGAVTTRPVQVGLVTSSLAEIRSGIAAGETIVTGTTSSLSSSSGNNGFFTGGGNFRGGGTTPQRVIVP
jgi:RND family efflux transporter MFP subunit